MSIPSLLLALLTFAILHSQQVTPRPVGDEIVQHYPDGGVQRRYGINADGQKHGAYMEYATDGTLLIKSRYALGKLDGREQRFFPSGKKQVVATWKAGELHGRYDSFHENGKRELSTKYAAGRLDGKHTESSADGKWVLTANYANDLLAGSLKVKQDGKTLTTQKWEAGNLSLIDGFEAFPRKRTDLIGELVRILEEPQEDANEATPDEAQQADPIADRRSAALRRLQAYRALCNLRYTDMSLVPEWNALCDAASEICRRLGRLSHTPERPEDTDEELYKQGYLGASRSNLSMGTDLPGSIDGYMDDSDPSNIDRVGHRRWCLNPTLKRTGFGEAERFSAMWSMDGSGKGARNMDGVLYPPPGYVPTSMFGDRHAWSITPLGSALPKAEDISIDLALLGEYYLPVGEPLELDHLLVSRSGGGGPCLIFRAAGLSASAGNAYRCRVSYDGGRSFAFDYIVEFISDERLH